MALGPPTSPSPASTLRPPSALKPQSRLGRDSPSLASDIQSSAPVASQREPSKTKARFAEPVPQKDHVTIPDPASDRKGGARTSPTRRSSAQEQQGYKRENGWQIKHSSVADRIGSLFNCHTMSDIIFHIGELQIPAHRCILGVTSPVFYHRLFEAQVAGDGGRSRIWKLTQFHGAGGTLSADQSSDASGGLQRQGAAESPTFERPDSPHYQQSDQEQKVLQAKPPEASEQKPLEIVIDYPFDAFFEFLRYIYKDELNITLDNVKTLAFLADDFNLPSLSERCLEFLRYSVRPETSLRVLRVLKSLLLKAVVVLWRDNVESSKIIAKFKESTLAQRKQMMDDLRDRMSSTASSRLGSRLASRVGSRLGSRLGSRAGSRLGSRAGSRAGSRMGSRPDSRRSSVASEATNGQYNAAEDEDAASVGDMLVGALNMGKDKSDIFKLAEGGKTIHPCVAPTALCKQFVEVGDYLQKKSWKCIRERTDLVLSSPEWFEEDRSIVKQILSLEMCSVSEIEIFRALTAWADYHCKVQGLATLPEHRRKVAGSDFIELIRFPVMKPEEFQWEVVPTGMLEYRDVQAIQRKAMNAFIAFGDEPRNAPPQEIAKQQEAKRLAEPKRASPPPGRSSPSADDDPSVPSASPGASRVPSRANTKDSRATFGISFVAEGAPQVAERVEQFSARRATAMKTQKQKKSNTLSQTAPSYQRSERLKDDDMDALLSARLWRNHVDELVSQQRALEALDGLDGDADKRVAFCGEPVDTGRPWSPPWRETISSSQAMVLGGSLPPASPSPRSLSLGTAGPTPRSSTSLGHRAKKRPKEEPLMALQTPRPASSLEQPVKRVSLEELEHLAHGFYRFRGDSVIEMRLEGGDPVVYEHRPSSTLGRSPTPEVQEALHGLRESEVRSSLGIRLPSTGSGVPLNDFLSGHV